MTSKRSNSIFTKDQEVFIVKKFSLGISPIEVKRAFIKEFGYTWKFKNLDPHKFVRIWKDFQLHGIGRPKLCLSQKGGHFEHLLKVQGMDNDI